MADTIKIRLEDIYEPVTEERISEEKEWTLLRNENAALLVSIIQLFLQDAARTLTQIAYRYNCKPEDFQFAQNKELREEVAKVMDELEGNIMAQVEEYALNWREDREDRKDLLLPWLLSLSSVGDKDLRATLTRRLRQFLFDTEAQIAAMMLAGYKRTKATDRVISTMHAVYVSPEMMAAFKRKSAAIYVNTRGVHKGNKGLAESGATNVESFAYQTAVIGWARSHYEDYKEWGAAGFYVLRGSNYHCSFCDSFVGFHTIDDFKAMPPFHNHCCCYTVPVYRKEEQK